MSTASSTVLTDDYGYEDEIKEFLKLAEDSKVNLDAWRKASLNARSNRELLREEMQVTIEEVGQFVSHLEQQAKMKKFRLRIFGAAESAKLLAKEKAFAEALRVGEDVIKKLVDALTMIPEPIIDQPLHILTNIPEKLKNENDPTRRLGLEGCLLISRFVKILDEEGIKHSYPVIKKVERAKVFRRVIVVDHELPAPEKSGKAFQVKDVESRLSSVTDKETVGEANRSPGAYLWHYGHNNNLSDPEYTEIFAVKNTWQQEYVYTCKLGKLTGRAKKRSLAKQIAAANVLRQIISKSRKKSLPDEMNALPEAELKSVLELTCEYIEYGVELEAVCSQENARPPIYTPLINKPAAAESMTVEIRCKALGFNAVGYGRDREVAKRMAAKLVLDQVIDDREKPSSRKGQTTKLDWRM